jgi:hypothetical protein
MGYARSHQIECVRMVCRTPARPCTSALGACFVELVPRSKMDATSPSVLRPTSDRRTGYEKASRTRSTVAPENAGDTQPPGDTYDYLVMNDGQGAIALSPTHGMDFGWEQATVLS